MSEQASSEHPWSTSPLHSVACRRQPTVHCIRWHVAGSQQSAAFGGMSQAANSPLHSVACRTHLRCCAMQASNMIVVSQCTIMYSPHNIACTQTAHNPHHSSYTCGPRHGPATLTRCEPIACGCTSITTSQCDISQKITQHNVDHSPMAHAGVQMSMRCEWSRHTNTTMRSALDRVASDARNVQQRTLSRTSTSDQHHACMHSTCSPHTSASCASKPNLQPPPAHRHLSRC
jgi:hypothetical protein